MAKTENLLYTATVGGDIESLNELLKKDKFVLNRYGTLSGFCNNETPLHIAATRGYVQFAEVLLEHKPCLVSKLDFQLRSPLHIACANGQVEMVDMLLGANTDLCLMEDQFGRTPLHIAATAMGAVRIVNKLVRAKPEVIMYMLSRTKTVTVLHLYVICNGPKALKQLVQVDHTFLNSQDREGNTILHKVVSLKKLEILEYLVSCCDQMAVNLKNKNSLTAWDILEKIPRDADTTKMQQLLLRIGAGTNVDPNVNPTPTSTISTPMNATDTWLEKRTSGLLVSATLIAGMAFQTGLNPPGGLWEESTEFQSRLHNNQSISVIAGTSIMAVNSTNEYQYFLWFNAIAFIAALSLVLLLISGPPRFRWFGARCQKAYVWLLTIIVCLTATMTTLTYRAVTYAVAPFSFDGTLEIENAIRHAVTVTNAILVAWMIFIVGLLLVSVCPLLFLVIKKVYRCIKKGEQQNLSNAVSSTFTVI